MKYIVGNPKGIRQGLPILTRKDGTNFYEGDEWTPQRRTPKWVIDKRVRQGYLIEEDDE